MNEISNSEKQKWRRLTVRVSDRGRARFRYGTGHHEPQKVWRRSLVAVAVVAELEYSRLDRLVDDEMDDRLRDAEVGGGDALVEASQAVLVINVTYALAYCVVATRSEWAKTIFFKKMIFTIFDIFHSLRIRMLRTFCFFENDFYHFWYSSQITDTNVVNGRKHSFL